MKGIGHRPKVQGIKSYEINATTSLKLYTVQIKVVKSKNYV